MEKRDVLNYLGEKVGELELPANTSEEVWAKKLAIYAAPPTSVFKPVSPKQLRQALVLGGVTMETVDASLSSLPEPTSSLAKIEWEYGLEFRRDSELLLDIQNLLNLSSEDLDSLWILAGTL